ncbi:MAG: hypothetical protein K2X43_07480 [Hyphomonadaceae bacterium]|nr:hypothetical protein [Hyphomonadaceae bacterium]
MGAGSSARHASRHSPAQPGLGPVARGLLAALSFAASIASGAVHAQTPRPAILIAATISAEPAQQAPLAIRIGSPEAVPKGSFIRIRGLPPTIALSDGHSIAPGSWAIPIAALPNLRITLPAMALGKSEISITLVGNDGTVLAEAKSVLIISATVAPGKSNGPSVSILRAGTPQPPAPAETAVRPPSPIPPEGPSRLTPEQRDRALRLVKRGDEHLAEGGIAQARLLYERAAEAGLAQGAMALAATYDAAELSRLGVRGLQPDRALALHWYERARQLGASEAEQRLRRLGAN